MNSETKTEHVITRKPKIKPKKKEGLLHELTKNRALFLMLLPGVLVMLVNNYLPMFGLVFAFRRMDNVRKLFGTAWVGLENFKYLFESNIAWKITRNNIGYNVTFILIGVIVPVFMAICLNELRNKRMAKIYQSLFFIPYFLSWVVISYLAMGILGNEYGALNRVLEMFGQEKIAWYVSPEYWPYIIVAINTWKWSGYDTIVYLASIVGVSQELFEAAAVDGASRFQQIWHITIPSLVPLTIVLVLIRLGRMFYTDMGLFYTVPRNMGPLINVTNTIDTYVYRAFIGTGDVGLASAAGFYQAVLGLVVNLTFNAIVRKFDKGSAII